jgi:hypothetical protein
MGLCNTIHHLLEYMGSAFKGLVFILKPMTNQCWFGILVGADLLPLLRLLLNDLLVEFQNL